jgi:hypothetical protein
MGLRSSDPQSYTDLRAAMSLEQGTRLRCGVNAPERLPVYPLLRERVRWPKLCGAGVTPRAVVLEASVPLAMVHEFARLILRL